MEAQDSIAYFKFSSPVAVDQIWVTGLDAEGLARAGSQQGGNSEHGAKGRHK